MENEQQTTDYQTVESEVDEYKTFEEMNLRDEILRGIYAYGFEKPSPIQAKAIVPLAMGKDIIAQAQSGTGKTGAFSIGILQRVNPSNPETQAILLSPTRELAEQNLHVITSIASKENIVVKDLIGGKNYFNRYEEEKTPQVLVCTPGRLLGALNKKEVSTAGVVLIVLDEADEMLSKGFQDQVKEIIKIIPKTAQVGLFSATIPEQILAITQHFMNDPVNILVKRDKLTLEGINQFYIYCPTEEAKLDCLYTLYNHISIQQTIIYANTKQKVDMLAQELTKNNFTVSVLHGGMRQFERYDVMRDFRSGKSRVLLTTDILSRGIDVQAVSMVINFEIPYKCETYIHRIGRSGRYGRKGVGINLVTESDHQKFQQIENYYSCTIDVFPKDFQKYL